MLGSPRDDRGRIHRPGLETTELSVQEKAEFNAPPPPDAFAAGTYTAVLSGATTAIVGVIMVIVSVLVLVDAARLPAASDPLGPAAFPILIGTLLGLVGIALAILNHRHALVLLRVRRGGVVRRGRGLSTVLVLVALLAFAALRRLVGFFLAAALLHFAVALLLNAWRSWGLANHRRAAGRRDRAALRPHHRSQAARRTLGVLTWKPSSSCFRDWKPRSRPRTCCGRSSASRSARLSARSRALGRRSRSRCCCRSPSRSSPLRRYLLRRHVRRLDDVDPAEHARRIGLDRLGARGQEDGALRPGAAALATAAIGSFGTGTIGTIGITLVAPLMAAFAITLGPPEYVALMAIAFVSVAALLGPNLLKAQRASSSASPSAWSASTCSRTRRA